MVILWLSVISDQDFFPLFLGIYFFTIHCHVSQCTKGKEETLLSFVFGEILRYSCERKCANNVSLPILWKSIFQTYLPIYPGALLAKLGLSHGSFAPHCFQWIRNIWCSPLVSRFLHWDSVLFLHRSTPMLPLTF